MPASWCPAPVWEKGPCRGAPETWPCWDTSGTHLGTSRSPVVTKCHRQAGTPWCQQLHERAPPALGHSPPPHVASFYGDGGTSRHQLRQPPPVGFATSCLGLPAAEQTNGGLPTVASPRPPPELLAPAQHLQALPAGSGRVWDTLCWGAQTLADLTMSASSAQHLQW